ncbi:MAG TPA: transcription antitermination factor NusB [Acidimicrobiia bacterium]|nr:transcription antitermination factor NusB [Acidimicrobiia bacterium]
MNKTDSRERAVLLLFETDSKEQNISATLESLDVAPEIYTVELLSSFAEFEEKVNTLISENSKGWTTDRMPAMDRAVLRMATTELVRDAKTPVGTVISEALALSEKYSTPESPKFINGVLGTIAHKVRGVELLQGKKPETDQEK